MDSLSSPPSPPPPSYPLPPPWAQAGLAALIAADPALAPIEAAAGPLPWRTRQPGFPGLLRAICGQQISNQAAAAIWKRLAALPGALEPAGLLAMDDATLCGVAGLSRPKAAHARSLATACLDGRLDFAALAALPDAEAVRRMVAVKGLGPWTAEIHLLFAEQRPDIFPSGDLALAASAAHLLGLEARPTPKLLAAMAAERWVPWRSLAARLLWHHWRFVTGRPVVEDG
ncbi:DNA-3-methyladenine glycosylase 2 family protein [Siccirubricoccus sp. KC 17139]|uniref:DNA-3-methyladenine glycosylase II n=1 Tax=Siccirubricoccus soli TaxID=2899147 RepID=A0ABT1D4V3_9PROT|nr:DNA-3-methyladenine glycosylase 2 family protein [Siccirubricoccus soli]MCO6416657.1 DNA-3-methyladenine glycosylase 2 family protein [Siccirubricoccus soli]MCP2682792.1 DNA-3-methyladenine glycosylase 2 family protein [Siccirubricoccus soli]